MQSRCAISSRERPAGSDVYSIGDAAVIGGWSAWADAGREQQLELSFATTELREICEKREAAISALGAAAALELEQRLADIEALESVADLAALFPADLKRSPTERVLRLNAGYRIVFRSGHVTTPLTSTAETDWGKVTRMLILAMEADHE